MLFTAAIIVLVTLTRLHYSAGYLPMVEEMKKDLSDVKKVVDNVNEMKKDLIDVNEMKKYLTDVKKLVDVASEIKKEQAKNANNFNEIMKELSKVKKVVNHVTELKKDMNEVKKVVDTVKDIRCELNLEACGDEYNLFIGGDSPSGWVDDVFTIPKYDKCKLSIPTFPYNVKDHVASIVDNHIIVCGGIKGHKRTNLCRKMDLTGSLPGKWTEAPSLSVEREEATSFTARGKMYVMGGYTNSGQSKTFEVLLPGGWQIHPTLVLNKAVNAHCSVLVDDRFAYRIGGFAYREGATATAEVVDLETGKTSTIESMKVPRHYHSCVLANIDTKKGIIASAGKYRNFLTSVEFYDLELKKWRTLPPINQRRDGHAFINLGGKPIVIGGFYYDRGYNFLDSAEKFSNNKWELLQKWLGKKLAHPAIVTVSESFIRTFCSV